MSKFADLIKNSVVETDRIDVPSMDILSEKITEDKIKPTVPRGMTKTPHQKCVRCGSDLGTVDHWFDFGVKRVQYGYTMLPEPLCKSCFNDLQVFMQNFEVKNES